MPSPFPGMDPFLDGPAWLDFHHRFVTYWCEAIADALPEEYEANIGERVYLTEVDPETRKLILPDIAVSKADVPSSSRPGSAGLATLEPITVPLEITEGPREAYVEILHGSDKSLVAVLELLSPSNKNEPGRREYLSKRIGILRQMVHLVELDLLLGGERAPTAKPLPRADCYYLVARAEQRFDCQVYHWQLRDPLPRLPVPLRAPDPDIHIDLATVFTTAYDRGRFGKRLRYDRPCPAPLNDEQKRWVETVLSSKRAQ